MIINYVYEYTKDINCEDYPTSFHRVDDKTLWWLSIHAQRFFASFLVETLVDREG